MSAPAAAAPKSRIDKSGCGACFKRLLNRKYNQSERRINNEKGFCCRCSRGYHSIDRNIIERLHEHQHCDHFSDKSLISAQSHYEGRELSFPSFSFCDAFSFCPSSVHRRITAAIIQITRGCIDFPFWGLYNQAKAAPRIVRCSL